MSVAKILAEKGNKTITLSGTASLGEAATLLSQHRIGAVLVLAPTGALAGILSERDIVKAIAAHGAQALNASVEAHMTAKVITCAPQNSVHQVMQLMSTGKFRHVPVLENGTLCGMISIGDVVKHRLAELEHESNALRDYISAG